MEHGVAEEMGRWLTFHATFSLTETIPKFGPCVQSDNRTNITMSKLGQELVVEFNATFEGSWMPRPRLFLAELAWLLSFQEEQ